jgi:RNA polymerase sigma-70 factor (ECF subfamily)
MMMCKEEAQLVQQAKEGDRAAFAEIYDRCQPPIYRYIFYRVSTEAIAEDLTSEVFVRMVDKIDDFTYQGRPLLAWLYTIARNLVNDHHRRGGQAERVPLDETLEANVPDPEGVADLALNQRRLAAALEQLTEGQRQVIVLKFLEDLDNKTVAQILDKSYGAVKALQHRGLASLRRVMDSDEIQ